MMDIIANETQKLNRDARNTQIANLLIKADGRNELAGSMSAPLRKYRDYTGVGRRAFQIDELAQGELAYYDKDIDTPSFIVAEEGTDVQVVVRGERVFVPLFEIATNILIPITKIRERRYDLTTRVKDKTRTEIIRTEDKYVFDMLDKVAKASTAKNPIITVEKDKLTIDHFSEAKAEIEKWGDVNAANVFINPLHEVALRKMNKDRFIDFETTKQLMNVGYLGSLFNMRIHKSPMVPANKIFITAEPEFFGKLVVGQDITTLNADRPAERQIGFSIFEQIGMLIHNDQGISCITLSDVNPDDKVTNIRILP